MGVASRKQRTYWDRVLIGSFALLLAASVLFFNGMVMVAETSSLLYKGAHWLMLLYCFVAGVHTTCDCISWEKREGTLGLLYLSNMSAFEIILGKLTTATLQTFYGLMVCFPLLALPILMGGVGLMDCVRSVLAAINLLFFSSVVGILCSVLFKHKNHSGSAASFILVMVVIAPWALPVMIGITPPANAFTICLMEYTNFAGTFIDRSAFGLGADYYWTSLAGTHSLGWLILGLSVLLFPRCIREKPIRKAHSTWHGWKHYFRYGSDDYRAKHRRRMLNINPFTWLATRKKWVKWQTSLLLIGVVLSFVFYPSWNIYMMSELDFLFTTLIILSLIIKAWIAGNASQTLATAREQRSLEFLLSVPLSEKEILTGQIKAILYDFRWAIAIWHLGFFILLWMDRGYGFSRGSAWLALLTAIFFLFDCYALTLLGMWKAITSKQTRTAASDAIARGMLFPPVIALFVLFFMGLAAVPWHAATIFWFIITALVNTLWIVHIKQQFPEKLREVAQKNAG
ncbi:MAG: hypothetical protein ACO1QB_06435 [Verrucomicrobiales bacterium]